MAGLCLKTTGHIQHNVTIRRIVIAFALSAKLTLRDRYGSFPQSGRCQGKQ
jgi:hypothetical protein